MVLRSPIRTLTRPIILYKEIFEDRAYLKHGITIEEGDCIIDIGANIGMFTLFAQQLCKTGRIFSFEPAPPVYENLAINGSLFGDNVTAYNAGVSDKDSTATFTYYPNSSVFSGFAADTKEDEKVLRAIMRNQQEEIAPDVTDVDSYINEFMTEDRLESMSYECQLRNLSSIIKENAIESIELLKLDAEKSELAVLAGIEDQDWPKIKQIVIEIHEDHEETVLKTVTDLLEEKGFTFVVDQESLLEETTFYNLYAIRPEFAKKRLQREVVAEIDAASLNQAVQDLVEGIATRQQSANTPLIVGICPASPASRANQALQNELKRAETTLTQDVQGLPGVHVLSSQTLLNTYPVEAYFDPFANQTGHVPYTETYFTALATQLSRSIRTQVHTPYKVAVLDCDNTLWSGVCAEDGALQVEIDASRKHFQTKLKELSKKGWLLCLNSKNVEEDVFAVFESHPDMILRKEDLAAWKINWESKATNLEELAKTLNLGLDSFVFIDDNPIECAEVRSRLPEVLTLQLPTEEEALSHFFDTVWAFDVLTTTTNDQHRTRQYQENARREQYRNKAQSLDAFLAGLDLSITIEAPSEGDIPRIAQLTQRTNQFNTTTQRRTEAEINQLLQAEDHHLLVVKVSDRFGDYGLVGVLIYTADDQGLHVDAMLLSCRALGRGVEQEMLMHLGQEARTKSLPHVHVRFKETQKNKPALNFLSHFSASSPTDQKGYTLFTYPADALQGLKPLSLTEQPVLKRTASPSDTEIVEPQSVILQEIQQHYSQLEDIIDGIKNSIKERPALQTAYVPPTSDLEMQVATIWKEVLHLSEVGIHDGFKELGGSSLQLVQIHSLLKQRMAKDLPLTALFTLPNVQSIAKHIAGQGSQEQVAATIQSRAARQKEAMARRRNTNKRPK